MRVVGIALGIGLLVIGITLDILGGFRVVQGIAGVIYESNHPSSFLSGFSGVFILFGIVSIILGVPFTLVAIRLLRSEIGVKLSRVYNGLLQADTIIPGELKSLARILKCQECIYVDKKGVPRNHPWCDAPSPPQIKRLSFKGLNCQTFFHK